MDWDLILPGMLAGMLVMLTHAPLGHEVLKRGVIFIDLAIAQFAAVGLVLGMAFGFELHSWQLQLTALLGALTGAAIVALVEHHASKVEAMIGILFVIAATLAVFISDIDPHGAQQLKDLLSGQILFIEYADLGPALILSLIMLGITLFRSELLSGRLFYVLFAFALTISVQHVGVYLVFASLIIPAYVTFAKDKYSHAVLLGIAAYTLGLVIALLTDWLSGPLIVWCMALLAWGYHLTAVAKR